MGLSIVIPVYNEEATIETLVERVLAAPIELDKELIVVDDGSTDGTPDRLERFDRENCIRVVRHARNRGKGAALRSGFRLAQQHLIIVQDADLEYDPRDYRQLLQPLLDGKAEVVFGSRFTGGVARRALYFWSATTNRFLTRLSNLLTGLDLTDVETGYKVLKRDVIRRIRIEEDGFGVDPELTAKIARLPGVRIVEVGVSYAPRTYEDGKKIGWRDGLHAIWCILKYNLRRPDR